MQCTDLMIGDLVQNQDGTIIGKVECIDSIKNRVVLGDHTLDADYVFPIPLTQEILEKNGFKNSYKYELNCLCYTIYSDNEGDYDLYICKGIREGSTCGELSEYQFTAIRYVHELQHALRLCGIEKEIEL